jgi:acetyl esterase
MTDVRINDVVIDGPHGAIEARTYVPTEVPRAGLAWAHGGGFIGGDLDTADWFARSLAARHVAVVSLDYRKAVDGVTYPVPADDVLAGWMWAHAHAGDLGVEHSHLHIGGASAGANLAASATLRCRDGAGPVPSSMVLACPALHAELPPPSDELAAALADSSAFRFTPEIAQRVALNYVGTERLFSEPYAFPAQGDPAGLPPTYILNCELDDLRASGEAFGAALERAGVAVRVELEPGTEHGHLDQPGSPEAQRSVERIVGWLTGGYDVDP